MRAIVHVNHAVHQATHGAAIKAGLEAHGVRVDFAPFDQPQPCDFAVCWGYRQRSVIQSARNVLVMERGYVGDRFVWTSLGWNGLNGRARFPKAPSGGRWETLFADKIRPWTKRPGYALIMGQVRGDASIANVDIAAWYRETAARLTALGWDVRLRQHPVETERGMPRASAPPALPLDGSLDEALAGAAIVVTYNSNTGVDAVLAGIPTVVTDRGGMAWPVAAHGLDSAGYTPDRQAWAYDLAYAQWSLEEISSGLAWEHVREAMPCPSGEAG